MNCKYPLDPEFLAADDFPMVNMDFPDSVHREEIKAVEAELRGVCMGINADGVAVTQEDIMIPGYGGTPIPCRVFAPANVRDELPCLINYHGGAFFLPWMPNHLVRSMEYAVRAHCKVLLPDYRLCMDDPFPVPVEDCYETLKYAREHADELGIDKDRIAVIGDSAGGSLAAGVCLMARDRGLPVPCLQLLLYPVLDSTQSSESAKKYTDTPGFNATGNRCMWNVYIRNGVFGHPEYAAPLLAEDLRGMPETYLEPAEFDCLHDEGMAFGERLQEAGVTVELNEAKGAFHGFDMLDQLEYSRRMISRRIEAMNRVFAGV